MSSLNCFDFGEYDEDSCIEYKGGNDALILVKKGVEIGDTTSQEDIQAAIDAGNAFIFRNILLGFEPPEDVEGSQTRACTPPSTLTKNRTLTIQDYKANAVNIQAWDLIDSVNGGLFGMGIVHSCSHNEQAVFTGNIL